MAKESKKNQDVDQEIETDQEADDNFEIEIVDDTPKADRNRPRRATDEEPEIPEDDEIADYGEAVQKRIKKLRYEFHEERRQKEEAQRMREEAIAQAERERSEKERLRKIVNEGESVIYTQAEQRIGAEIAAAKKAYKEAYETGDADAMLEASEKLTKLNNEHYRVEDYKRRKPAAPPPERQQVLPPQPTQKAREWAEKNKWFHRDRQMTAFAYGVHEDLVLNHGVQPDTDEYYRQIDDNMRKRFPEHFEDGVEIDDGEDHPRKASVVAPSSRSVTKNRRKIRLTQTQVSLAKRLGLTNEQYAAQLAKESING
jgi:hypothetical protein